SAQPLIQRKQSLRRLLTALRGDWAGRPIIFWLVHHFSDEKDKELMLDSLVILWLRNGIVVRMGDLVRFAEIASSGVGLYDLRMKAEIFFDFYRLVLDKLLPGNRNLLIFLEGQELLIEIIQPRICLTKAECLRLRVAKKPCKDVQGVCVF